ncbi:MAG: acyl-ACP thioesterase domain-containing protein [Vicinamibacteria bacterium]
MSATPAVLVDDRLVEAFHVDALGRLKPEALFGYLLNIAWNHAKDTSYGFSELAERNLMWVLIKVHLVIHRHPRWHERVRIETWGKGIERLYALRDFAVTSESGERMISGTSTWLVLDRTSGRPQRFDLKTDGFPWFPEREEMKTSLDKVPAAENGTDVAQFEVVFSDIDVNQHVNSARYLQWMMDSHSREHLQAKEPASIELSFLLEAMPDDRLTVTSAMSGDGELCSLRRDHDQKEVCRARFEWRATDVARKVKA